jgi:hypothetical protein
VEMGVAVWLADCWPKGIVHAGEGLVSIGRPYLLSFLSPMPYLLRLDRRHNQAESDQE